MPRRKLKHATHPRVDFAEPNCVDWYSYPDMIDRHDIEEFARKIAEQFHPEKIILFGSYAYGTPTPDSDVDIMVIMDHDTRNVEKAIEIRQTIRRGFPLDLFVRRAQDIETRIGIGDQFIREIIERGEVLYEATYA